MAIHYNVLPLIVSYIRFFAVYLCALSGTIAWADNPACYSTAPAESPGEIDNQDLSRESIAERLQECEITPSYILSLPTAERRIIFANTDYFLPVRDIIPDENTYALEPSEFDLSNITYTVGGKSYEIEDFLSREALMGLIVVQGRQVLLEHYAPDHGPTSVWNSFSVTKSITSLLIGAAVQDGYISSVNDKVVDYIPNLRGSAYADVTIRDLLHMKSGVAWNENYKDPESDTLKAGLLSGVSLTNYLKKLPKQHQAGTVFHYSTGEANLIGEVLRTAIGSDAATYLTTKIWRPFGMEHKANWLTDVPDGNETGGCCISASLRDYARIGLFALSEGELTDGTRVLPEDWMHDSTTPFVGNNSYGYLWWLLPGDRYGAGGVFGQKIFIDPITETVVAVHSNAETPNGGHYVSHLEAVLTAIFDDIRAK